MAPVDAPSHQWSQVEAAALGGSQGAASKGQPPRPRSPAIPCRSPKPVRGTRSPPAWAPPPSMSATMQPMHSSAPCGMRLLQERLLMHDRCGHARPVALTDALSVKARRPLLALGRRRVRPAAHTSATRHTEPLLPRPLTGPRTNLTLNSIPISASRPAARPAPAPGPRGGPM